MPQPDLPETAGCLPRLFAPLLLLALLALLPPLVLSVSATPSLAASALKMPSMDQGDSQDSTWTLNSERMFSLAGGDIMEAQGNVELRMGNDILVADFARYYTKTNWIYLSGNVKVRMGGDELTAASAEFNLSSRTGWLTDGQIFLAGPHLYMAGERITKFFGDVYDFKNATITACDGDSPAWSFAADSAVVELDGYAQLWGTSFRVKNAPVVYSPFMIVPAKTERQTGFLVPEWGHDGELGEFFNLPFFWAIDSSRDLTINEYYMSKQGWMHGLTYRSRGSEDEKLWLRFDWMRGRNSITEDGQGGRTGDNLVRTNEERWWLRGMYDWRMPGDPLVRMRADLDLVSDQDFLREFQDGMSGFDFSREELFGEFSRDLRERDLDRVSTVMLFREWQRASLYLSGAYEQNPALGHGNLSRNRDDNVQTMPSFDAFLHKGRIFADFPLEIEASAQAAYKYRREGTRGARYDLVPRVSLPLHSQYGSIIASAALRSTWYNTEYKGENPTGNRSVSGDSDRMHAEFDIQGSTEFSRNYALAPTANLLKAGDSQWSAIRHSIVPRVTYSNRNYDDQSTNPYYDEYDQLSSRNELVYSIENTLTRKRERMLTRKNAAGEDENYVESDYRRILRLRLEQAYDIHESNRDYDLSAYPRRPFRDIMAEAEFYWDEGLSFTSRSYWSPNTGQVTKHSHGISLSRPEFGSISTGLTFLNKVDDYFLRRRDETTMLTVRGDLDLYGPFSAIFYYNWSVKGPAETEKGLQIIYDHQCFQLLGQLEIDRDDETGKSDTSVRFMFKLTGLGLGM
ncbi:MAG: LPS assembly protein LptD [Deltaproteobacteria bacterium]|jgi:LPS-assembly protein|nr:LPS assembly protein LptD [Deltaproteobacteria bacterium]